METFFNTDPWEHLSPTNRIAQCRQAAQTAQLRVHTVSSDVRPLYEKLVAEWNAIADEIAKREHRNTSVEDT